VRVIAPQHQPVALSLIVKLEASDPPPGWQPGGVELLQDAPHQKVGVKVGGLKIEPLLPPDTQAAHQFGELASGLGKVVGRTSASRVWPSLNHPVALEAAQTLSEHARRDGMKALQ